MAEAQPGQVEQSSVRAPIFTFRDQVKDFARPNLFQVEVYAPPILAENITPAIGGVAGSQQTQVKLLLVVHNLTLQPQPLSVPSLLRQQTFQHQLLELLMYLTVVVY